VFAEPLPNNARWEHFTETLLSNDRNDAHSDTECCEGIMKYAVEMDTGALIYVPSFIKIGSGIQKGGIHRYTDNMEIA
jgi:hypothetical protein